MARGIVYVACGPAHGEEARCAIRSVRSRCGLPITVFTDLPAAFGGLDVEVCRVGAAHHGFQDKVDCIPQSPYDETLFLDTDTLMLRDDAADAFELLERFDMALAQAFVQQYRLAGVPAALAELNSGVILFRKSQQVEGLLRRWQSRYREAADAATVAENPKGIGDQQILSQVVWESGVRMATLPPEWNYRGFRNRVQDFATIRILHNREAQRRACRADGSLDREALLNWFRED